MAENKSREGKADSVDRRECEREMGASGSRQNVLDLHQGMGWKVCGPV